MSLVNTYTFEEGTNGSTVPSGSNGVVAVGGTVTYDSANAIHGSMAVKMVGSAASLVYLLPTSGSNSWSDSFYMKIGVSTGTQSVIGNIRNGSTQIVKLFANPTANKFIITNQAGTTLATSTISWSTGQIVRCDLHYSYASSNVSITWQLFVGSNSEGTTPDDTLSATVSVSAIPARFALGSTSTGWTVYYDTYRQYSSSTDTIAPYNPTVSTSPVQLYNGTSLVAATVKVALPGGSPNLNVDFEDGTTGGFSVVQGATVGSSYAYSGTNGCRLSPASGTNYATLTYNGTPSGHAWARFTGNFRIVTITNPSNTYTNVFEVGNALTVSPKDQFTVYVNGPNLMMDFRTTTDATLLDDNVAVGVWHSIDVSVNFGVNPYIAHVTYDGVRMPDLVSKVTCTPTTVGSLWVGYPSTVTDQTTDWDNIQLTVGDSDPALGVSLAIAELTVD